MKTLILAIALLAAPALAQAQNPCTTPPDNQILTAAGTNHTWVTLSEHDATRPDGTPVVLSYQYGAWPATSDPNAGVPPTQGPSTLPKTAFIAVPGFAGCYELTGGLPGLIPSQTRMVAGIRAVGQPNATTPNSAWGVSNSFSLASTPVNPAAPGQVRIKP
jgi:hypothetical protein